MKRFDQMFFWTLLSPADSGLPITTYVTMHLTHRRPTLLVGEYGRNAAVVIDYKPRILGGILDRALKRVIFEWINLNRKTLLEYWNEEISTTELIRDLINMNQVIKREPTEKDLTRILALCRDELLTVEYEVELVKQIRQSEGDVEAAKEKLMRANQRFVRAIAQKYVSEKHSLKELMADGNLGLEHAIFKFDETRGFKLGTYAVWWIRQSIQQAIVLKAREESELRELSERELDILRMYFGFGREKASLEEIQAKYDLTRQRAMAIKDMAIHKLFKSKEKLSTVRCTLMGDAERDTNEN